MVKEQKTLKEWLTSLPLSKLKRVLAEVNSSNAERLQLHLPQMIDQDTWWTKRIQYRIAKGYCEYVEGLVVKKPVKAVEVAKRSKK